MSIEPLQVKIITAAQMLDLSERTVRRLIEKSELVAIGRGKLMRVDVSSIHDYRARNMRGSHVEAQGGR